MTMRTVNDTLSGNTPLVDKRIGNAFGVVQEVADNLNIIRYVADYMNAYAKAGGALTVAAFLDLPATTTLTGLTLTVVQDGEARSVAWDLLADSLDTPITVADLTDGPGAPTLGVALETVRVNAEGTALEYYTVPAATVAGLTDGPGAPSGHAAQMVRVNTGGTALEYYTPAAATVAALSDGPGAPTAGVALKAVRVNAAGAALEYYTPPVATVAGLSDGPGTPAGHASQAVRANAGGTALEYYTPPAATVGGLSDGPGAPTGQGGKPVRANSGGTALEYYAPPYDIALFIEGVMKDSETVLRFVAPRAFTIPSGAAGSYGKAGTAATGSTTLTLYKNGISFGTLVWSAAGTAAVVTVGSATSFVAGDVLSITCPATADATLADIGITLAGTRS